MSVKTLVELGPSIYPSKDHILKVNPRNVVFVAPEHAKFDFENQFPGSIYFNMGFLEYLDRIAQLDSVDELLCINVLNSAREGLNLNSLLRGANSILATGGILRIENTTDQSSVRVANLYAEASQREGFATTLYMANNRHQVQRDFVQPNLWHNAKDDGFSILATKV